MKPNQRLKRERELRGWSQAKVASEVGTDPATVSRWERGLSFPYPYFREKLCLLFGKNAEELGLVRDGEEEEEGAAGVFEPHALALAMTASSPPVRLHDPAIPLLSSISVGLVGRDSLLHRLRQRLAAGEDVGSGVRETPETLMALNGLPGVGKTSLSVQLAYDQEIRHHFYAGVLWAGLGPRPNVLGHLSRWGALLGIASKELVKKG